MLPDYRVTLVVTYLGWFDVDLVVTPSLHSYPANPAKLTSARQKRPDCGKTQNESHPNLPVGTRPPESPSPCTFHHQSVRPPSSTSSSFSLETEMKYTLRVGSRRAFPSLKFPPSPPPETTRSTTSSSSAPSRNFTRKCSIVRLVFVQLTFLLFSCFWSILHC